MRLFSGPLPGQKALIAWRGEGRWPKGNCIAARASVALRRVNAPKGYRVGLLDWICVILHLLIANSVQRTWLEWLRGQLRFTWRQLKDWRAGKQVARRWPTKRSERPKPEAA
jgi:hypothetical protein